MDMRVLVGQNVRRLRLDKGMTQEELAERSGFDQRYISLLELGKKNPTIVSLYQLSLPLGVEPADLISTS